jgi:hypothetical protein
MGGYDAKDEISTYPSIAIAKDGTIYALYNESRTKSGDPVAGKLRLLTSKDSGRTWTERNVTPAEGIYRYTWLDVAPDGTLGIAYYFRPDKRSDWYVYASTAKPGQRFIASKVSNSKIASKDYPSAFGDFFQIAFGPDNKLNVVWTSQNTDLVAEGLNTDIYFSRQK